MLSQKFIVSMASALVFAGAAQAAVAPGFVSIDSFGIADAISPSLATPGLLTGYNLSAGSGMSGNYNSSQPYGAATSRDLIGNWKASGGGTAKGSNSVGTSAMTMSYGGTATTGTNKWFNTINTGNADPLDSTVHYSYQTSIAVWGAFGTDPAVAFAGAIDMSGLTDFSFDLSGYQTTGTLNTAKMYLRVLDNNGALGSYEVGLSNGHVDVAASNFGALDWSSIYQIEMVFTNTKTGSSSSSFLAAGVAPPTGTVTVSNFGYLAPVPAPGAVVLIGLAGMVAGRRRRN